MPRSSYRHRRGGVYLAVLGAAMIVTIVGVAGIAAVRVERLSVQAAADAVQARANAATGIEMGLHAIDQVPGWRSALGLGVWSADQSAGSGTYSLEIFDRVDGVANNSNYHPAVLRGTGVKNKARQILEVTLVPGGDPLPALAYALHVPGELLIKSGKKLTVTGAAACTNTTLNHDGTLDGDGVCLLGVGSGTMTGTLTIGALPKAAPDPDVVTLYAALGTPLGPAPNTLEKVVLSPLSNPWGNANPNGVYVISTSNDVTLRDCRIHGTLVIRCGTKKVTVDKDVLIQPFRDDFPTLVVEGAELILKHEGDGAVLSEADTGTNFNPAGSGYQGVEDADLTDTYPSQIQGLVHVTGKLSMQGTALVKGAVLCGSGALTDAAVIDGDIRIEYDADLFLYPPWGYVTNITPKILTGSWTKVVLP